MEHSVQAYLERRTDGELVGFLRTCMLKNQWTQYAETVPLVFQALKDRGVAIPDGIEEHWEVFLKEEENPPGA